MLIRIGIPTPPRTYTKAHSDITRQFRLLLVILPHVESGYNIITQNSFAPTTKMPNNVLVAQQCFFVCFCFPILCCPKTCRLPIFCPKQLCVAHILVAHELLCVQKKCCPKFVFAQRNCLPILLCTKTGLPQPMRLPETMFLKQPFAKFVNVLPYFSCPTIVCLPIFQI